MEEETFVLKNIPTSYCNQSYAKDLIINYIEGITDINVKDVKLYPFLPRRALVFAEDKINDFREVAKAIRKNPLESQVLTLVRTFKEPAVVIEGLDVDKLSEEILCLYFTSQFLEGKEAISTVQSWPEFSMAVVHFNPAYSKVVADILRVKDHVPLPSENYHISVVSFYRHFHDRIDGHEEEEAEGNVDEFISDSEENLQADCEGKVTSGNEEKQKSDSEEEGTSGEVTSDSEGKQMSENDRAVVKNKARKREVGRKKLEGKEETDSEEESEEDNTEEDKETEDDDDDDEDNKGDEVAPERRNENLTRQSISSTSRQSEKINGEENDPSILDEAGNKDTDEDDDDETESVKDNEDSKESDSDDIDDDDEDEEEEEDSEEEDECGGRSDGKERWQTREKLKNSEAHTPLKQPTSVRGRGYYRGRGAQQGQNCHDRGGIFNVCKPPHSEDMDYKSSLEPDTDNQSALRRSIDSPRHGRGAYIKKFQGKTASGQKKNEEAQSSTGCVPLEGHQATRRRNNLGSSDRRNVLHQVAVSSASEDEISSAASQSSTGLIPLTDVDDKCSLEPNTDNSAVRRRIDNPRRGRGAYIKKFQGKTASGQKKNEEAQSSTGLIPLKDVDDKCSLEPDTDNQSAVRRSIDNSRRGRGAYIKKFQGKIASGQKKNEEAQSSTGCVPLEEHQATRRRNNLGSSDRRNVLHQVAVSSASEDEISSAASTSNNNFNSFRAQEGTQHPKTSRRPIRGGKVLLPTAGKGMSKNKEAKPGKAAASESDSEIQAENFSSTVDSSIPEKFQTDKSSLKAHEAKHQMEEIEHEKKLKEIEEECNRIKAENDRLKEKSKLCTEKLEMKAWQADLLQHCFGQFKECTVTFNPSEDVAILNGPGEEIQKHEIHLLVELKQLNEELVELTPAMISVLSREAGKLHLDNLTSSTLLQTKMFVQDKNLMVAAKHAETLKAAVNFVEENFNYKETFLSQSEIPNDKLTTLQLKLENCHLVQISWNESCTEIVAEGLKDAVSNCRQDIDVLLNEYDPLEQDFNVLEPKARFFHKLLEDKGTDYLGNVTKMHIDANDNRLTIHLKGPRKETDKVCTKLKAMEAEVISQCWDIKSEFQGKGDLMLITQAFHSKGLEEKIEHFELKNKCCITLKLPNSDAFVQSQSDKMTFTQSRHRKDFSASAPRKAPAELKLKVTPTCQLIIKSEGDITRETSDILVCVLTEHVDLRKTRIGQAFNRACSSIWKTLKDEHAAHQSDAVLTTTGPFRRLRCQAICHMILSPWNPNTSPAQLDNALKLLFTKAAALGAKSISFPALGCGRLFQFPPENVAQIFMSSIDPASFGSLNEIVLLAADKKLYKELEIEGPKKFQAVSAQNEDTVKEELNAGNTNPDTSSDSEESEVEMPVEPILPDSHDASVTMVTQSTNNLKNLWSKFATELKTQYLNIQQCFQEQLDIWPKESVKSIFQKAKELGVWVERCEDSSIDKCGFMIKGEKNAVEQMKTFIIQEEAKSLSTIPKSLRSKQAPQRGTLDFVKYASTVDEACPSYWRWNHSKKSKKMALEESPEQNILVDVDEKTKSAIIKIVKNTWSPSQIGRGNDAAGLNHQNIEILKVQRVENVSLFEIYSMQRKSMFKKIALLGQVCKSIATLPGSKGQIMTSSMLDAFLKDELYDEINEHYVFHGTKNELIPALSRNGIDPKVSSHTCMFGKGVYAAEEFTKADQYTDERANRTPLGTELTVILARMLLGNVFVCDDKHESVQAKDSVKLTRPPCIRCLKDRCKCPDQVLYDSVMGEGKWIFREFIVYDQSHCYPEYVITYKRK